MKYADLYSAMSDRPMLRTEMSLHVLAYNLRRLIAILDVQPLMEAVRA